MSNKIAEKSKPKSQKRTFTEKAHEWFSSWNSIPRLIGIPETNHSREMLAPPISFLPPWECSRISRAQGGSISIHHAKLMVVPDGEIVECMFTKKEFQPVKILKVDHRLMKMLKEGNSLTDLKDKLEYYGVFFPSILKDGTRTASGSIFWRIGGGHFVLNQKSPLAACMIENATENFKKQWKDRQEDELKRSNPRSWITKSSASRHGVTREVFDTITNRIKENASTLWGCDISSAFAKTSD